MSINNSMLTPLNSIPIDTNIDKTNEKNNQDFNEVKELFKDYENKENEQEIMKRQIIEQEMLKQKELVEIQKQQILYNQQKQREEELLKQNKLHDEQLLRETQQNKNNVDFEKEMENLIDGIDETNIINNDSNENYSKKKIFMTILITLIVFIILINLKIMNIFENILAPNLYDILISYEKLIILILTLIIVYILYYFNLF